MNGIVTKYYEYKTTSGRINIPKNVAKVLKWIHGDNIEITIEMIDGQKGIFLVKK